MSKLRGRSMDHLSHRYGLHQSTTIIYKLAKLVKWTLVRWKQYRTQRCLKFGSDKETSECNK